MSINRISPASFINGSIVTPAWLTSVSQALNASAFGSAALADDFIGSAVSTGLWSTTGGVAIASDGGTNGVVSVTQNSAGTSEMHTALFYDVGTADFYNSWRMRVPAGSYGNGCSIKVGFWNSGTAAEDLYFYADGPTATWKCMNNATTLATSSASVTSSTYALFEIYRSGGVLFFTIGGTIVYQGGFNTNIAGGPQFKASVTMATQAVQLLIDRVRAYVDVT